MHRCLRYVARMSEVVTFALFVILLNVADLAGAANPMTQPAINTIVIATNNWPSQVVGANVIGSVLDRSGFVVVYKISSIDYQISALGQGELHIQTEIRESVMEEQVEKGIQSGQIVRAGRHQAISKEGWWYPNYVQAACPGLPDWKQLNVCAEIFQDPSTQPLGRFLAGPKSWGYHDQELVAALKLHFQVVNVESPPVLLRKLEQAWKKRQPILMFHWSPSWTDIRFPGHFVTFPKFEPNCVTDPSWGPNPHAIYDCDMHRPGAISKVVWARFPKKQPCAFKLINRASFTSRDLASMDEMVTIGKLEPSDAAQKWLAEHESRWRKWIPDCAKDPHGRKRPDQK